MILSKTKPSPVEGDYKVTKHFAWFPVTVAEGHIWLESYKKIFEYKRRTRTTFLANRYPITLENCGDWDLVQTKRSTKEVSLSGSLKVSGKELLSYLDKTK